MNKFTPMDNIQGVWYRSTEIFKDERGYFFEEARKSFFPANVPEFIQDSISYSKKDVLRGMHLQQNQWQLVTLLSGEIIDVVINLDANSQQFRQSTSINLRWDSVNQILIQPGIAHGYAVLDDFSIIHYKSSVYYGSSLQSGIHWQSTDIINHWPKRNWIVSERDSKFKFL